MNAGTTFGRSPRRRRIWALAAAWTCAAAAAQAQPTVPPLPPPGPMAGTYHNMALARRTAPDQNLLILIHGWNSTPAHFTALRAAIVASGEAASWMIWDYDWREDADRVNFLSAVENTPIQGQNLAFQIAAKSRVFPTDSSKWGSVHIVSHSLGAPINEFAARRIAPFTSGQIQQTFLDPSLGGTLNTIVGATATVAENYYSPSSIPTTGKLVPAAFNVNLDAVNPYFPSAATHAWPTEWYKEGLAGTMRTPKSDYGMIGWGFSREKALADSRPWPSAAYAADKGKNLKVDAQGALVGGTGVLEAVEGRQASLTPINDQGQPLLALDGNTGGVGLPMSASAGDGSAAALLNLDTRNAGGLVNTMTFEYRFDGTIQSPREGFLSIALANEAGDDWTRIYSLAQEFEVEDGWLAYEPVPLLRDLPSGEYAMHVSFHSLDGLPTGIELRNMQFVYRTVIPEPAGLALAAFAALPAAGARRRGARSRMAKVSL